jgi:hypothetical protein
MGVSSSAFKSFLQKQQLVANFAVVFVSHPQVVERKRSTVHPQHQRPVRQQVLHKEGTQPILTTTFHARRWLDCTVRVKPYLGVLHLEITQWDCPDAGSFAAKSKLHL